MFTRTFMSLDEWRQSVEFVPINDILSGILNGCKMDAKCFGISMWEHITHTAHKHVDYSWHAYVVIYAIQREKNEQKNLLHGYDSPTLSNI